MTNIKPCLFCCGVNAAVSTANIHHDYGAMSGHVVECCDCKAVGPFRQTEGEAVDKWNEPARWCDHCETWAEDYRPMLDPWGKVHDWWCATCEDNHDPEPVDAELTAEDAERLRREVREAGR